MKSALSAEAARGLEDLFFFCNHFVGLTLEEQPHREMCNIIERAEKFPEDHPYAMLVVPRGTYKSSIAIASIPWKFLRQYYMHDNVYHRIVIASATLGLGKAALQAVEGILRAGGKNERINEEYGVLWFNRSKTMPGSRREDGIVIAPRLERGEIAEVKEPNLFIGSMRRISTGFHADEALVDDLNNKENVKTDHQRKQTHTYWRLLMPILGTTDRGGKPTKVTMLCTPWHDDDVRGMILREEAALERESKDYRSPWVTLHRGAINEDETPFFPSKYPISRLQELRRRMGATEYSANYLCDPVGENGFVPEDLIVFKARESFPPLRFGRIVSDPNQHKDAKELGCYAAIVVAAFDKFNRLYILEALGSREWNTSQYIDVLFGLQEKYPDWPIFIEDAHMGHFDHAVRLEEVRRSERAGRHVRLRVNFVPVDRKTSKYERWQRIQPRFLARTVTFSDEIAPSIKSEIKDELVRGEAARFKDFLDALAMADFGFRPRVSKDGTIMMPEETPVLKPGQFTVEQVFGEMFQ